MHLVGMVIFVIIRALSGRSVKTCAWEGIADIQNKIIYPFLNINKKSSKTNGLVIYANFSRCKVKDSVLQIYMHITL